MLRIILSRLSRTPISISRLILGLSAFLLVIAVALVGIEPESESAPVETAPNTVVITKPPTTTSAPTTTSTTLPPPPPTTTTTLPEVDPSLPCQEWLPLALQIGWPSDTRTIEMLLRVMNRESRCRPEARSTTSDTGLLQLNDYWCEPSRYTDNPSGWLGDRMPLGSCADLTDPVKNLQAGLLIWLYSENANGNGWHPWRFSGPTE